MPEDARALLDEALAFRQSGNSEMAVERAQRAIASVPAGDAKAVALQAEIGLVLGNALADCGRYDEADVALQRAGEEFVAARQSAGVAQTQISRGRILAERGETALAIEFFSRLEGMDLPDVLMSQVLNNLGLLNRRVGDLGDAIHYLARDAESCTRLGDRFGAGVAEYNLAGALAAAGRPREAAHHATAAADKFGAEGREDLRRQALEFAQSLAE